MVTVFYRKPKSECKETFTSLKEAKSFLEKLSEENMQNMLDVQVFVHIGKRYNHTADYTHEVHWTTETDMFSIQFESELMARAFYSQMFDLYHNDWHSIYLFEHLGQGRIMKLRHAVKV